LPPRAGTLTIEVWDSGVGIAAAERDNIFMEFHQVDNPERDRSKGMGLGLAIVRRTADLLRHPLSVRSRPGRGSVFALTLPLGDIRAATPVALKPDIPAAAGQCIFVIEDDADNVHGLRLLLETWNYRVVVGGSGDDILRVAAAYPRKPDLILSDFRLRAHETGIEVIDRLHEEYGDDAIPAVLMSGDTDPQRLIEASARSWPCCTNRSILPICAGCWRKCWRMGRPLPTSTTCYRMRGNSNLIPPAPCINLLSFGYAHPCPPILLRLSPSGMPQYAPPMIF